MRIFEGMFAAVLKDRFRLSASALGTNPFFGFLCICHNQAFELMFAFRNSDAEFKDLQKIETKFLEVLKGLEELKARSMDIAQMVGQYE